MSDLMNNVSKDNIRSEMNLIYTMMKFMSTILDMVPDSKIARDTLCSTAEGVFSQATDLYRDVGNYAAAIVDDADPVAN